MNRRWLGLIGLAGLPLTAAASVGVSISIGQPGVYGRIDLGRFPPPAVVFAPRPPRVVYGPPPQVYYAPPSQVYYAPPRWAYARPPRVVVVPAPVVWAARPVVAVPSSPWGHYGPGPGYGHHHGPGGYQGGGHYSGGHR